MKHYTPDEIRELRRKVRLRLRIPRGYPDRLTFFQRLMARFYLRLTERYDRNAQRKLW